MANPFTRILGRLVSGVSARGVDTGAHVPNAPQNPYDRRAATLDSRQFEVRDVRDLGVQVEHADGWLNQTTGMGDMGRDKLTAGYYQPLTTLDYGQIESLYYGDDMCERIVDALPDEAFRRGFELEGPLAEKMQGLLDELDAETKIRDGFAWGRLWGGAALVLGIDDGQTQDKPLDVTRVRGVKFMNVVDRRYVNPLRYYEAALAPKLGEPETYTVTPAFGRQATGIEIHETRLIRFYGTKIDPITTRRLGGWAYSVLQRPYDVLRLFASAFQAAGQLANDAGQAVFSVSNLVNQLTSPQKGAILQRFASLDQQRWAGRMLLLDKDKESFARAPVQVAGVSDLLEHFEMRLAAAARMPVTMLMGKSPAGMNATGESDARQWHSSVKAAQSKTLGPVFKYLLDILSAGAWSEDPSNKLTWLAMEDPNDKEEAEVNLLEAQTFKLYFDMGSLSGEQVTLVKFCGKSPDEVVDEEACEAIIESDYELAKNPPPAPAAGVIMGPKGNPLPAPTARAPAVAAAPPPRADAKPSFASRNASFLADLRDYEDRGLVVDQGVVDRLAAAHDVPAPKRKGS